MAEKRVVQPSSSVQIQQLRLGMHAHKDRKARDNDVCDPTHNPFLQQSAVHTQAVMHVTAERKKDEG